MKKLLATLVVAVLCALGCFSLCACDDLLDVNVERLYGKCDTHEEFDSFDGALISVKADACSVYVRPNTENAKVKLDYIKSDAFSVTGKSTLLLNTIFVEEKWNTDGISGNNKFIIISIPSKWTTTLTVEATAGSVYVDDLSFVALTVSVTTGSVHVNDCKVLGTVGLSSANGSIDGDYDALSTVVNTTTGKITLDCDISETATIITTTGSVDVDMKAKAVLISATTGSIRFDLDATAISLETETGSIRGHIAGTKADYTISAQSGTGSCNLTNQKGEGNCELRAKSQTGTIKITFAK